LIFWGGLSGLQLKQRLDAFFMRFYYSHSIISLSYFGQSRRENKMEETGSGFEYTSTQEFNASEYKSGCPEGKWTGRLDQKLIERCGRLELFFCDVNSGEKYSFPVFEREGYAARDRRVNFHNCLVGEGDVFELNTYMGTDGFVVLFTASKISCDERLSPAGYREPALEQLANS
jgi:hypothetical protein